MAPGGSRRIHRRIAPRIPPPIRIRFRRQSSAAEGTISGVGTTFWIFVGIALIQAVVGGLAKAAEKRKKREAAKARGATASSGSPTRGATARLEELQRKRDEILARRAAKRQKREMAAKSRRQAAASGTSSRADRTEDLRRKRIEELRRRTGAPPAVAAGNTPPTPPGVPPIVVSVPEQAPKAAPRPERRRSATANESKPEPRVKTRSSTRPTQRRSVSERGSVADRAKRSKGTRGGSKLKSAAKTIVPSSSTPSARSTKSRGANSGGTGGTLAGRLRNRDEFQRAILMAELVRPPVGLRSSSSEDRNV